MEVVDNFPEECRYVLETLRDVYHHDALAREQAMSPEQRLRFHQEHSEPLMKGLHEWMEAQLAEHKTEPNSGLGKAISYLLNHWTKLTLFLRQPGAPIDNNIVERALKKAILNRKNALFYKTLNGAGVGDLFMSLIHTCELNGANPFDYLTELQRLPRKHVTCKWVLLYIERWLKAPMVQEDGTTVERSRGTPQGGVAPNLGQPLYALYVRCLDGTDNHPGLPWCRYADDGLVHCRNQQEAQALKSALQASLAECRLELHPTKPKSCTVETENGKGRISECQI